VAHQLVQRVLSGSPEVDEIPVVVSALLLCSQQLDQTSRFATCQLVDGIAGRRQSQDQEIVSTFRHLNKAASYGTQIPHQAALPRGWSLRL